MAQAGSVTTTAGGGTGSLYTMSVAWTSDASGNVQENPFDIPAGQLVAVDFIPGSGGVQPTDQYDVTILNEYGADVLATAGANRSNSAASVVTPTSAWLRPKAASKRASVDVKVSAAGNAKQGTVVLTVKL